MKLEELLGEGAQLQEGVILPVLDPGLLSHPPKHSAGWRIIPGIRTRGDITSCRVTAGSDTFDFRIDNKIGMVMVGDKPYKKGARRYRR